jgi:hypothetical protein
MRWIDGEESRENCTRQGQLVTINHCAEYNFFYEKTNKEIKKKITIIIALLTTVQRTYIYQVRSRQTIWRYCMFAAHATLAVSDTTLALLTRLIPPSHCLSRPEKPSKSRNLYDYIIRTYYKRFLTLEFDPFPRRVYTGVK